VHLTSPTEITAKERKKERKLGDLTELLKNVTESCLQNQVPKRCQVFARIFDYNNKKPFKHKWKNLRENQGNSSSSAVIEKVFLWTSLKHQKLRDNIL